MLEVMVCGKCSRLQMLRDKTFHQRSQGDCNRWIEGSVNSDHILGLI